MPDTDQNSVSVDSTVLRDVMPIAKERSLLVDLSIAALMLVLAASLGLAGYLAYLHPVTNQAVAEEIEAEQEGERLKAEQLAKEKATAEANVLKEWRRFRFSDVATKEDNYPIVVMQTGFKVLRLDKGEALVGWKFDLVNTSPNQEYFVEVAYKILDDDGFQVATSTSTDRVRAQQFGAVQDTLIVKAIDLGRLRAESWTVRVTWPGADWKEFEKKTKGTRYERLAKIPKDDWPQWASQVVEDELLVTLLSEKWKVARQVLKPDSSESAADERAAQQDSGLPPYPREMLEGKGASGSGSEKKESLHWPSNPGGKKLFEVVLPDGVIIKGVPEGTSMNELAERYAAKFPEARWPAVQDKAAQGSAEAQYALGAIYSTSKDLTSAAEWFRKAAEQGHAKSQSELAAAYLNGEGVVQDAVEGYAWLRLASQGGDKEAANDLRRITRDEWLTPTQIAEAQKLSRELCAKIPNCTK